MNKAEMIEAIVASTELPKVTVTKVYDSFVKEVALALSNGDDVSIHNIGKLSVTTRAERVGRNPQNGEPITIKEAQVVKLKVSSTLKDFINF